MSSFHSYIPLNLHSYYSFGWGIPDLEKLISRAQEFHFPSLALTDLNGLYGTIFFLQYCRQAGIRPIIGAEVNDSQGNRATLLVSDRISYQALCHLITQRHTDRDFNLLQALREAPWSLFILTPSISLLSALKGRPNLFVQLLFKEQNWKQVRWARSNDVPLVATPHTFFLTPEEHHLHRLIRAIHLNRALSTVEEYEIAPPTSYFPSPEEFIDHFTWVPDAIRNTYLISEQCTWEPDWGIIYPPCPEGIDDPDSVLREKAYQGAQRRYGIITDNVKDRIEHELRVIREKGFAPVFLVVEDLVKVSPRTCGRGSAAASIISYCLGITQVDPIAYDLFFERFINPARVEPPDIDLDFAWDERDTIIDHIINTYGNDRVGMVSTHVTFGIRGAVRELAKVYGIPDREIARVTGRIETSDDVIEVEREMQRTSSPYWQRVWQSAIAIRDIPRHLSLHPGGMVITPQPIWNYVPVEKSSKRVRVLQWEKDQTEEAGLVKIDILGNRSLAVIRDTLKAVNNHYGIVLDLTTIDPVKDLATQELIARGETMGVFYVESPAMRLLQKRSGVGDFEHLVLHTSIIRPASNRYINLYLRRLKGEPWEPLHPNLSLLNDNYGIMVYQEDVTRVAMALAGFTLQEADELRKIVAKKHKKKRLMDLKEKFFQGAVARGVGQEVIDEIWEMISSFSGYSFCKPHSASYALVSYQSAFLKAHFPAEFMAAVISNQGGYYSTFAYISEARRMGLAILPPHINLSQIQYTGREGWIRIGLQQIKGIDHHTLKVIIKEREREGDYKGLEDFLRRTATSFAETRSLILAGCFDQVEKGLNRPEMLWALEHYQKQNLITSRVKKSSTGETLPLTAFKSPLLSPSLKDYDTKRLWELEEEHLGFLISAHPLQLYQEKLKGRQVVKASELHRYVGEEVDAMGWLVTAKVVPTRRDEPMEFLTFEDTTGLIETVLFPDAYARFARLISYNKPYLLKGKVKEEWGAITMEVKEVRPL